jgi:tRNA(Ile)-lysidine synthase
MDTNGPLNAADPLVRAVRERAVSAELLRPRDKILAAVSGGPDSLVLLHILWSLKEELGLDLAVGSLDHGLRGAAGQADVTFVGETAHRLGLPFWSGRVEPTAVVEGASLEEGARRARYEFLGRLAREWGPGPVGPARVATGHTADDQAETVIMRVIEGTGPRGLAGMPALRQEDGWVLIRPLLRTRRFEIEAYCRRWALEPRTDETNRDERFRRNFIRARVMPLLREGNPRVEEALVRLSDLVREETKALEAALAEALSSLDLTVGVWAGDARVEPRPAESPFEGLPPARGPVVSFGREAFRRLDDVLQRRLVRQVLAQMAGEEVLRDVGFDGAAQAARAAATGLRVGGRVHLPGKVVMEAGYRRIFFAATGPPDAPGGEPPAALVPVELRVPGSTVVDGLGWSFTAARAPAAVLAAARAAPGPPPAKTLTVDLDPEAVRLPLSIRTRRPGDAFRPAGQGGGKKLKDFLIGVKLPRAERDRWPLLVDAEDRIVWVVGFRADERFVAPAGPGEVLRVTARRAV